MVVNFEAREISRDTLKLTGTPIYIYILKENYDETITASR